MASLKTARNHRLMARRVGILPSKINYVITTEAQYSSCKLLGCLRTFTKNNEHLVCIITCSERCLSQEPCYISYEPLPVDGPIFNVPIAFHLRPQPCIQIDICGPHCGQHYGLSHRSMLGLRFVTGVCLRS